LLRVSSLASLAALIKVSDLAPATRRGRAPIGLAALAAALLAIGFLFAPAGPRTGAASPFERTPVDGRLLVIGWDGMPAEAFGAPRPSGRSSESERERDRSAGGPPGRLSIEAPPIALSLS